jgi:sugar O-acyltransferase (sialic acid O-acetyltransferase NeuD family)
MKKKVAVIGGGDLGKQLLSLLNVDEHSDFVGFYDDTLNSEDEKYLLGGLSKIKDDFKSGVFDCLMLAVGYKHMNFRADFFNAVIEQIPFYTLIHPSCIVHSSAIIGDGSVLYPGCIIDKNVIIGRNVLINLGVIISHETIVGDHSFIAPGVRFSGFDTVGKSCFMGTGVILRDNIKISDNITAGAGAVIINDLTEKGIYVGNPAKKVK